jgi:hypothetical protein
MTDEQLLKLMQSVDPLAVRVPPGIRAIALKIESAERERCAKVRRFAGWFRELPSGMSYRLWEQGGHEQTPGDVALYE